MELEQADKLEDEEAKEDDEVERPGCESLAELAQNPRAAEPPDDPDGPPPWRRYHHFVGAVRRR